MTSVRLKPKRVALLVETSVIYGRQILRGISRYLFEHHPWSIFMEQRELGARPPAWLRRERWDGIICRPTDRTLASMFRSMRVPVVDLNDQYDSLGFPRIVSDNRAIGRTGAAHLLERGLRQFGFCGFTREPWAAERLEGFCGEIQRQGFKVDVFESRWRGHHTPSWDEDQKAICRWLRSLARPVGIMACNDVRGQHVLNACTLLGLAVPEELAVIGVDNETTFCELCSPPLSSVIPNPERIGYEAAALLDRLMSGGKPGQALTRLEPVGVEPRQSTEVLAIGDPSMALALRYIREQALHGCTVEEVARFAALSRSVLERRFRKYLRRSPQAEIRNVQIARVKQLLLETDHKLTDIADLCGFKHPEYLNVMFKRVTGQNPGKYRETMKTR